MTQTITSIKHPLVQAVKAATPYCDTNPSLLQDEAACRWALAAGLTLDPVFVCLKTPVQNTIEAWLQDSGIRYVLVSSGIMQKIKQTKYPSPIAALANTNTLLAQPAGTLLPILDNLQDPGNMGTICRSASAFAINHIATMQKAPIFHKKAISASRGHVFNLHYTTYQETTEAALALKQAGYEIWLTCAQGELSLPKIREANAIKDKKIALIIGNETTGGNPSWHPLCDHLLAIPMHPSVESLNAAVAASLCFYEMFNI